MMSARPSPSPPNQRAAVHVTTDEGSVSKQLRRRHMKMKQNPKYDIASLLGADTRHASTEEGQQLPGLAFVLQQGSCTPVCPAPQDPHAGPAVKQPPQQTTATKRRASECEGDKDTATTATTPTSKKCRGKWRKPTYLVRKEEKYELLEHIKELESQMTFLRNRTNIVAWQEKDRQQIETEIHNNVLRNSVKQHQLQVLSAQSALSELTHSVNNRCPLEAYIHLGCEWAHRTETLSRFRAQQCRDAVELVERRTQFMTEAREYTENAQFVDEAGDFCSIRFDITPLEGLKTVNEAFDFIQFHIKHMDTKPMNSKYTCTSEHGADNSIMHRRLIISEVENVATETNFVMFSEKWPGASHHKICGDAVDKVVMVMNFVDEDDLYPRTAFVWTSAGSWRSNRTARLSRPPKGRRRTYRRSCSRAGCCRSCGAPSCPCRLTCFR